MKIVHICLACFYVEGMGYQENILPKMHAREGNDVTILTSDFTFTNKGEVRKKDIGEYINEYNVKVKIIQKDTRIALFEKYRVYKGLYSELEMEQPDIIFVHGGQFFPVNDVIRYVKRHNAKLFMDQHGDYYNMPVNNLKGYIWQKIIYRPCMRKLAKFSQKVYGVTPWRCQYLNDVYGIDKNKIELLVMGGDDERIDIENRNEICAEIRKKHNIKENDFLIVTGGKIDKTKNIHLLMKAISNINRENVKLIVFGEPNAAMEQEFEKLACNPNIRAIGWLAAEEAYNYFLAADLVVFPGTHSVMWEQACACAVPCIFKHWEGMHHVDIGGNCEFLYDDSVEEMERVIVGIIDDEKKYLEMKKASQRGITEFSYKEIAKRAINF